MNSSRVCLTVAIWDAVSETRCHLQTRRPPPSRRHDRDRRRLRTIGHLRPRGRRTAAHAGAARHARRSPRVGTMALHKHPTWRFHSSGLRASTPTVAPPTSSCSNRRRSTTCSPNSIFIAPSACVFETEATRVAVEIRRNVQRGRLEATLAFHRDDVRAPEERRAFTRVTLSRERFLEERRPVYDGNGIMETDILSTRGSSLFLARITLRVPDTASHGHSAHGFSRRGWWSPC